MKGIKENIEYVQMIQKMSMLLCYFFDAETKGCQMDTLVGDSWKSHFLYVPCDQDSY